MTTLQVTLVPVEDLLVWDGNPRKDAGKIDDLAESISTDGILEPLIVRNIARPKKKKQLQIVCGWRRKLAAEKAGLKEVPCLIRDDVDDSKAWRISMIENIRRLSLNPLEEAEAFEGAFVSGMPIEDIADSVKVSPSYVARRRALLNLTPPIQKRVRSGDLTISVALEIARIKDKKLQKTVAERVAPFMSARQARNIVRREIDKFDIDKAPFPLDAEYAGKDKCDGCPFNSKLQGEQLDLPVFTADEDEKYDHYDHDGADGRVCYDHSCFETKYSTWSKEKLEAAKAAGKMILTESEFNDLDYEKKQGFQYQNEYPECEVCDHGHTLVFDDKKRMFRFTACQDVKCYRRLMSGGSGSSSSGTELSDEEKEERRIRKDRHTSEQWLTARQLVYAAKEFEDRNLEGPVLGFTAHQIARNMNFGDYEAARVAAGLEVEENRVDYQVSRFEELLNLEDSMLLDFISAALGSQAQLLGYEDSTKLSDSLAIDRDQDIVIDEELLTKLSKRANQMLMNDYDMDAGSSSKKLAVEKIMEVPESKRKGLPKTINDLLESEG